MRISDWSSDVCSSDLLVVGGALERGPLDAGLGRESLQRARGLAVGVEGDVEVGAEDFGRLLGLLDGDGRQQHRQSARSEEHTSELQSLMRISYAVFCLKKKKSTTFTQHTALTETSCRDDSTCQ